MNRKLTAGLFALVTLVFLGGCKQSGEGYEYDEALAGPDFTGAWVYDVGTVCAVGDATMHCCPPGMAMIGVHIADNVFKCAQLTGISSIRFLDVATVRNDMHACPSGGVMVGLHVINNQIACQTVNPGRASEHVDGNPVTLDGYPMHVCPGGYAMGGIHMHSDFLTCDS